jgi:hypothetical protein
MPGSEKGRPPLGSGVQDVVGAVAGRAAVGRGRGRGIGEDDGGSNLPGRGRGRGSVFPSVSHRAEASIPLWKARTPAMSSASGFVTGEAGQGGISRGPEVPLPMENPKHGKFLCS